MATIKKPVVQKAQKGILKRMSCPSNVRDCGPTWGERRAIRKEENRDERQTRRAEKITLKQEKKTDKIRSNFQTALGNSEPPKLTINYNDVEKGGMKGKLNPNSAKKGTKLSKSMKTGGKMIKKSPKKK
jgi:hypothetical protein